MHADDIDNAAELEQLNIEIALANRPRPEFVFTGSCAWCEEKIATGQYCDAECRHDHELYAWGQQQRRKA